MKEIVDVHFSDLDSKLLNNALDYFYSLRARADIRKKPSTSELVDWISALVRGGIDAKEMSKKLFSWSTFKKESDLEAAKHPYKDKFSY